MIIPSEFLIEFNFCLDRVLFILLMNSIEPFDSFLILCSYLNLLEFCFLFPFFFFLIELLQFFPQLVGLIFLPLPVSSLFTYVSLVSGVKMLIIIVRLFLLLLQYLGLVLDYFFCWFLYPVLMSVSIFNVFLFLLSVEVNLIFGSFDGKLDVLLIDWIWCDLHSAYFLTTIDLEAAFGSSW